MFFVVCVLVCTERYFMYVLLYVCISMYHRV